ASRRCPRRAHAGAEEDLPNFQRLHHRPAERHRLGLLPARPVLQGPPRGRAIGGGQEEGVLGTDLTSREPTMIAGMQWIDVVVLVAYLLGVVTLGVWTVRKVRGLSDFLMPRRFGTAMMIMHAFGTGTSSDQAVAIASATFRFGLAGIWYQWMWLFATPFYWLI